MLYIRHMIRTQVYLPKTLYQEVSIVARIEKKARAQVIRDMLEEGISNKKLKETIGQALNKLIKVGKKLNLRGPKDLSTNHDKYLYEDV